MLGRVLFSFITLNILCHSLLACRVSAENLADILRGVLGADSFPEDRPCDNEPWESGVPELHLGVPLYVICCFSIVAFNILSVSLIFVSLITMCLYPARLLLRFDGEIKSFPDKQKLRKSSTTKLALQQMLCQEAYHICFLLGVLWFKMQVINPF